MNNNEMIEFTKRSDEISKDFLNELIECTNYKSMGTLNYIIDVLEILRDRIENGQKIKFDDSYLTTSNFKNLVEENFPTYVLKGVFSKVNLKHKVFFKLENTNEGMDLVYTGDEENKLFKWIADLNNEQCLMRLLPTNVVYIRNNKNNTYIPFVSEHNSCYVYDEKDGKIKEYFKN